MTPQATSTLKRVVNPKNEAEFIVFPQQWSVRHWIVRTGIMSAERPQEIILKRLISALMITDEFHLEGLEGNDPTKWDFEKVELSSVVWLIDTVESEYLKNFSVSKKD